MGDETLGRSFCSMHDAVVGREQRRSDSEGHLPLCGVQGSEMHARKKHKASILSVHDASGFCAPDSLTACSQATSLRARSRDGELPQNRSNRVYTDVSLACFVLRLTPAKEPHSLLSPASAFAPRAARCAPVGLAEALGASRAPSFSLWQLRFSALTAASSNK
jgi:hypothetical protein